MEIMRQLFSEGPSTSFGQREDQVAATRRTLQQMNAAANRAIDFHVTRSQFGPKDQVAETRRVLEEMNAAADRAIDDQSPMTPYASTGRAGLRFRLGKLEKVERRIIRI